MQSDENAAKNEQVVTKGHDMPFLRAAFFMLLMGASMIAPALSHPHIFIDAQVIRSPAHIVVVTAKIVTHRERPLPSSISVV